MEIENLISLVDHTLLRPDATLEQLQTEALNAITWGCAAFCVNSGVVYNLAPLCRGKIPLAATIGFPLGATSSKIKVREAKEAVYDGASEVDMVINLTWLKSGFWKTVQEEIEEVRGVVPGVLKVIVETGALTQEEKELMVQVVVDSGADFIKTSTGFYPGSVATVEDIALFKRLANGKIQIKASGGISTVEQALALAEAGANRLGMSRTAALAIPARAL